MEVFCVLGWIDFLMYVFLNVFLYFFLKESFRSTVFLRQKENVFKKKMCAQKWYLITSYAFNSFYFFVPDCFTPSFQMNIKKIGAKINALAQLQILSAFKHSCKSITCGTFLNLRSSLHSLPFLFTKSGVMSENIERCFQSDSDVFPFWELPV